MATTSDTLPDTERDSRTTRETDMNSTAVSMEQQEKSAVATLAMMAVSLLLLMPLIGGTLSCLLWTYVTRSDFNPLYQD